MNIETGVNDRDDYHMLKAEALLAGTLALMTAHAQCTCPKAINNKDLMTKKIISNLSQLARRAPAAPNLSRKADPIETNSVC